MSKGLKAINLPTRIAIGVAVVLLVLGGGTVALARSFSARYADRILPNTFAAGVDISALTHLEAAAALNTAFDAYLAEGFAFVADGAKVRIDSSGGSESSRSLVALDADGTIDAAMKRGHGGNRIADGLIAAASFLWRHDVRMKTSVDEAAMTEALRSKLAHLEKAVSEPVFVWSDGVMTVPPGAKGKVFDVEEGIKEFTKRSTSLSRTEIAISSRDASPEVSDSEAASLAAKATTILSSTPLALTYEEGVWKPSTSTTASWLKPSRAGGAPAVSVDAEALGKYLDTFRDVIEVTPQDARFAMKDGRAVEFTGSMDGVAIDVEALAAAIAEEWIGAGKSSVAIPVEVEKATVTTDNVNDLGIDQILGSGVSTYYGSHAARIKNLKNALRKLNGLLIAPDAEFSLVAALSPFTLEGGWLPEKVIKGDEIKSEIGGGACQIGTTTFRAAMNSGLPIVERQNHSLVVSYYNDPSNGNPGTDATIYDPSPDFRFKNDTGHYILFQTAMDEAKQKLTFTFWGTSDGRKGSYTPPVVHKWYSPGPTRTTLTTSLAPGAKDCQAAYKGADTSFTYSVVKPDGTEENRVFTSHYRPLGSICMVGATAEEVAAGTLAPSGTASSTPPAAQ